MIKYIKSTLAGLAFLVFGGNVIAQDYTYLYVNYNPSFTVGDSKEWADEFSWRGVTMDLRIAIDAGGLTAGIYSGWTVFREESQGVQSEVIQTDEGIATITAKQYFFINQLPLLATMHYHFGKFGEVRPYVGLGTGVYFTTHALEMGLYRVIEKNTQFGLAPMVGVSVPMNRDTNFNFGAIYNQAFATSKQQAVSSIGFNIGFGWRFY